MGALQKVLAYLGAFAIVGGVTYAGHLATQALMPTEETFFKQMSEDQRKEVLGKLPQLKERNQILMEVIRRNATSSSPVWDMEAVYRIAQEEIDRREKLKASASPTASGVAKGLA